MWLFAVRLLQHTWLSSDMNFAKQMKTYGVVTPFQFTVLNLHRFHMVLKRNQLFVIRKWKIRFFFILWITNFRLNDEHLFATSEWLWRYIYTRDSFWYFFPNARIIRLHRVFHLNSLIMKNDCISTENPKSNTMLC